MLILNADDWGRNTLTTDRIHDCVKCGSLSSVSAMVFMEDSQRSASIARENGIDAGLHLNFTTEFDAPQCSPSLLKHQHRVSEFLRRHPAAQAVFHPGLISSFEYLVKSQCEQFTFLYGRFPERLDGHHHMHLCANVLLQGLLPAGKIVRRNFSFRSGQKSVWNRLYRRSVDKVLARHHRLTDYFFSIVPFEPAEQLKEILSLAKHSVVEVETHPADLEEHTFLTTGAFFRRLAEAGVEEVAPAYSVPVLERNRPLLKPNQAGADS